MSIHSFVMFQGLKNWNNSLIYWCSCSLYYSNHLCLPNLKILSQNTLLSFRHISNCLLNFSSWILHRHLKLCLKSYSSPLKLAFTSLLFSLLVVLSPLSYPSQEFKKNAHSSLTLPFKAFCFHSHQPRQLDPHFVTHPTFQTSCFPLSNLHTAAKVMF